MIVNYIYIYTYMCVIISILLVVFPLHACILEFSERTNQRIQWPSRSNLQGGLRSGAGVYCWASPLERTDQTTKHSIFYPSIYGFFWSSMIIRVSMCLILFVHLLLYPFIELSITSIYPSIYRSIHWSSCLLWIHRSICLPLKQSTDQSTNRSFIPSFIHSFIQSVSHSIIHSFLPVDQLINQAIHH